MRGVDPVLGAEPLDLALEYLDAVEGEVLCLHHADDLVDLGQYGALQAGDPRGQVNTA